MATNWKLSLKLVLALSVVILIGIFSTNRRFGFFRDDVNPKVQKLKLQPNFKAEHLYSPSEAGNGSWVAMCFDDKGRMITSDQYGYLYRLTIPPIGADTNTNKIKVEKLEIVMEGDTSSSKIKMGFAHGLLYAFNSLYVMVNNNPNAVMNRNSGLYRLQDMNNDDQFDKITLLKNLVTPGGEHGPHSIVLAPDKKSIYVIAGNHTDAPEMNSYRLPKTWKEDNLFPLIKDPNGHANDIYAPGGWIAHINPEGTNWELVSAGYRNPFDIAFNEDDELFTYDADMEWDFGMPWYRPTRINHVTSGSEYGWRTGNSKWSATYPDNLPAVLNIGQGSPTSLTSGKDARFPEKYRRSLFAFDWSFGIIYSILLRPEGSSYKADAEVFVSGTPLPVTDGVVGPDGALYFLTGGRRLDSDMYRVYYGDNNTPTPPLTSRLTAAQKQAQNTRKQLEKFHEGANPQALITAWPHLKNPDRFIRYAARIAVEHQPVSEWQEKALSEKDPQILTQAMIALARCGTADLEPGMINALASINFTALPVSQKIDVVRAFELIVLRMGKPEGAAYTKMISYLNPHFPATTHELNRILSKVLVHVDAPQAVTKTMALMATVKDNEESAGQKTFTSSADLVARHPMYGLDIAGMLAKTPPAEKIYYLTILSEAKKGWTPLLREKYFKFFNTAFSYKGGNSYIGFIEKARKMALANVPKEKMEHFNTVSGNSLVITNGRRTTVVGNPKGPGRDWKIEDALAVVNSDSTDRNFAQGKMLFSATLCATCHSMRGEGGGAVGPDLTQLGTRFSNRDILESIILPSKVISDQYAATDFKMKDGSTITGRLKNEENGKYYISMNPFAPQSLQTILKKDVVATKMSEVSIMYPGTINRLNKEELKDLMAYLTSGANKNHEVYKPKANKQATASSK
ncbi:MAG: heme-binding protein [Segetibacter sp.]|nr:heme-binding protein [Segetibacter sp.]